MPIITPLETDARTLSRPNTDAPGPRPPRWERVGTKPPARLQLLREDPCVIKDSAFHAKYADIFEKNKPLNCYHGRYTYRLISWLLRRLPCGEQVTPKRHLKRKWRFVIPSRNKPLTPRLRLNKTAIMDMEDIRYTIRKGRYSDKQTTKRSFPIPALM